MRKSFVVVLSLLLVFVPHLFVLAMEIPTEVTVVGALEPPAPAPGSSSGSSSGPEPAPDLPAVLINEILADPKESDAENEFIELYNAGTETVDLSGWRLDDARVDDGAYQFSNENLNHVLFPGSYLALFRPETRITLNNDTDSVILLDPDGREVDRFDFASQGSGRSWGRNPENLDEWLVFKNPTPGQRNEPAE